MIRKAPIPSHPITRRQQHECKPSRKHTFKHHFGTVKNALALSSQPDERLYSKTQALLSGCCFSSAIHGGKKRDKRHMLTHSCKRAGKPTSKGRFATWLTAQISEVRSFSPTTTIINVYEMENLSISFRPPAAKQTLCCSMSFPFALSAS